MDLYLIKAGALGDTFWTRTHGDSADDVGRTVHRTSDGGYIISGRTNSIGAGEDDFYLIKTDDLGNIHDCGTVSLLAPEDTVFTDYLYVPQARVRNFGNLFKTIDVFVTIGSYADTVSGVNLAPRSETLVAFAPWTVPPSDSTNYTMSVCTEAPNDFNTTNDCRSKNIFAFTPFHDIGVISLDAPGDTVFTDSSVSVRATVKNFGFYNETFDVIATIDGYSDTVQVTGITPGNSFQVSFANWTVPSMDSTLYTMTVCAQLPSDVEPSNNCDSKIIFAYSVVHDGGVITIDSPEDTVFTDSSYSVRATVKNFGETYIYCNVIATIDGYSDTIWVSNLPPQSNTRVVLKPWRVPMNDSTLYSMKVCTYLTNDTDTTNDCAEKSIFAFNPVGIEESMEQEARSTKFALLQNLPNPFNQFTVIRYQIPTTNHLSQVTSDVTLKIYDLTGNLVATLIDEKQEPGLYQIPIRYDQLPSNGVYFIRMKASPNRAGNTPLHTQTRKMILLH